MKYVCTALLLGLAACAPTEWVKYGYEPTTQIQRDKDVMQCEYEASKAAAGTINGMQAGWEKSRLMRQCMKLQGYFPRPVSQ